MRLIHVGIGEIKISKSKEDVLYCYGLGSCVAVCLYDDLFKIGGMFHCVLPGSNGIRQDIKYANIGIEKLINDMLKEGAVKFTIKAGIIGGANILKSTSCFDIGNKNVLACKEYLQKNFIELVAEDVGKNIPRTVKFFIKDGSVVVTSKYYSEEKILYIKTPNSKP